MTAEAAADIFNIDFHRWRDLHERIALEKIALGGTRRLVSSTAGSQEGTPTSVESILQEGAHVPRRCSDEGPVGLRWNP